MFVSFQTRADSISLDFLDNVAAHCKRKGLTNFELITRISAENKSGRWDNNFIMTEVGNVQNLNKVIVCGPPVMSETFERCLHDMIKQKKISRS